MGKRSLLYCEFTVPPAKLPQQESGKGHRIGSEDFPILCRFYWV